MRSESPRCNCFSNRSVGHELLGGRSLYPQHHSVLAVLEGSAFQREPKASKRSLPPLTRDPQFFQGRMENKLAAAQSAWCECWVLGVMDREAIQRVFVCVAYVCVVYICVCVSYMCVSLVYVCVCVCGICVCLCVCVYFHVCGMCVLYALTF